MNDPTYHLVVRSLSRPLTLLGAERRLFISSVVIGGATFNLMGSLLAGLLMFLFLYLCALFATRKDPQMIRILLRSGKMRSRYDPSRRVW